MRGIDVSKQILAWSLVDPDQDQVVLQGETPNTRTGVLALHHQIPASVPWVLEPTGSYSVLVARLAQQQGRTVYQAPPAAAHSFLSALPPRAKTNQLDIAGLARFALARRLHRFRLPTPAQRAVASLLVAHGQRGQMRASLCQQRQQLPEAAEVLAGLLADLERRQSEVMTRLQAVPGVGQVTAISLGLSLVQIPFRRSAAFVAYLGLDVWVRPSGQWRGKGRLSKRGPARLRQLLDLAAQATSRVRREPSPFRMQYERERAKGLPSTAALCAVARKLAQVCWSLVHRQTSLDPERVYAPPVAA